MNQKNTIESARLVSLAMALVLFFVLGAVAFVARAETTSGAASLREEMQANMEERQEQYEKQALERREMYEENQGKLETLREEGASNTEIQEAVSAAREERAELLAENREERRVLRQEQRDEIRQVFEEEHSALQTRLEERKQEREERKEEYKARLSVQQQAHLSSYSENMSSRMEKLVEQLELIAARIAERIEKLEEMHDVDLSDARDGLAEVYTLIDAVKENIALLQEVAEDTFTSEDPKTQVEELREAVRLVKDSIGAVHAQLQETVVDIKASLEEVSDDTEQEDESDDGTVEDVLEVEHSYSDGVHTYSGTVTTPTPCYTVDAMAVVAESYPEQITVDITLTDQAEENGGMCTQVLDEKPFSVDVNASEEAELVKVRVDGEDADWELAE